MNALIVENLTKKYPSFSLDKVSFSVANGHIAGLIGANGAGKSTIIKSILQLVSANGKITVFGKDISDNEIAIKQLIGFVGGGFRFYPMKKLSSVRKIYAAFYPAWNQEKYNNYLLQFNISESKRVKELSDGMKIKFALALALSHGAKLLILDEPTSGLDPLSREEFCDIMLALVNSEHVSILFSTHITSDLMRIADDVIYISRGRVLADCPLRELTARYSIGVFDTLQQAEDAKAIGIKSVKSGYEGLLLCNSSAMNANAKKATLDDIMIHLEIAAKRK